MTGCAVGARPRCAAPVGAGLMKKLRAHDDVSARARALELMILCATREVVALGATWDEFKLQERLW